MTKRNSMFEMLKSLIPPSIRPQADSEPPSERPSYMGEKVRADIDRIISEQSLDMSRASSIEEAVRNEFRKKMADILGIEPDKAVGSDYTTLEAYCSRPSLPPTKRSSEKQQILRMIALTEGLDRGFSTVKELEAAIVRKRVQTIARQEGLDPELTAKEGIYRSIMLKYMAEREKQKRKSRRSR